MHDPGHKTGAVAATGTGAGAGAVAGIINKR